MRILNLDRTEKIGVAMFAAAFALVLAVGFAKAADIPKPTPRGTVAPSFSWTGFYLGGHAGYGWSNTSHATPALGGFSLSSGPDGDGFLYGIDGAALYQFPGTIIVAGGVLEYSWGRMQGSSNINLSGPAPCGPCGPLAGTSYSVSIDELGSAKALLGFSMGRVLPYATAGFAFAKGNAVASAPGGSVSASDDLLGWTIGGGVKWAMTDILVLSVDYGYYRFDDGNYAFNFIGPIAATANGRTEAHVLKAGLGVKF